MTLKFKNIFIFVLASVFFCYAYQITNYFSDLTLSGDLIKYKAFWNDLKIFQINKLEDIANEGGLLWKSLNLIGSVQFVYPFLIYFFSKVMSFETYLYLFSGIYSFLFTSLFLKGEYFLLRLILIFPAIINIYAFGLFSVLDRLKIALILFLLSLFNFIPKKFKPLLLITSVLTHFTMIFIAIPLAINQYFQASSKKYLSTPILKIVNLSKLPIKKIIEYFIFMLLFILIIVFVQNKFLVWFPVIKSFFGGMSISQVGRRILELVIVTILMFPNFGFKKYPRVEHFLSILPIILATLLLGSFRTLNLAYIYYGLCNSKWKDKSLFSFLQLTAFSLLSALSVSNGILFISKLQKTGFGF